MAKKYYDSVSGAPMISNDSSKPANMPQDVVMRDYPKNTGYLNDNLNDGISGVDGQISKDNSKKNKNLQPEKY